MFNVEIRENELKRGYKKSFSKVVKINIINKNYNQIALEQDIKVEAKVPNCETKEFKMW